MTQLNQLLAVLKGVRSHADSDLTTAHHTLAKDERTAGIARTYKPKNEDGDQYPDESKAVEIRVDEVIAELVDPLTRLFDVTLQQETANQRASADVVVDGQTVLANVPVTYLLFLEKKLVDLRTFASKLPVWNTAEEWEWDADMELFKTEPFGTKSTKKVLQNHTKWAPPDSSYKQEAQVETFTSDEFVGTWLTIKYSGAISPARRREIVRRVDALADAVKMAREQANTIEVGNEKAGKAVFDYLFGMQS